MPKVSQTFIIGDAQERKVASKVTFANHKIATVVKQLRDSMVQGKIEASVHWSAELLVGGNVWNIWESIFFVLGSYYYTHAHTSSYVYDRYERFKKEANGQADINLRDSPLVRSIIAEVVSVLASGDKRYKATRQSVADEMFNLTHLKPHLKATSRDPGRPYIKEDDPPEAAICANELAYALSTKNLTQAHFWTEWLLTWQRRCVKHKISSQCATRKLEGAHAKHTTTPPLLLWAVLAGEASKSTRQLVTIVACWQKLFMIKFTTKVNPTRSLLLHAAVFAVCNRDRLVLTKPLSITNLIPKVMDGLPLIYERICTQCQLTMQEELGLVGVDTNVSRGSQRGKDDGVVMADDPLFALMPNPLRQS